LAVLVSELIDRMRVAAEQDPTWLGLQAARGTAVVSPVRKTSASRASADEIQRYGPIASWASR
jgi:hypothetical protein